MELSSKIEAILFAKGEPMSIKKLVSFLEVSSDEAIEAINQLESNLSKRGIALVRKDDEIMLGTNSELSSLIEKLYKEELVKDLSKASLETIAIILYKNGATRSEIDWIRGVNSSFILRNLLIRGLVEKITDTSDTRRFIYMPTFDLITFLGLSKIEDLPNYSEVRGQIERRQVELEEKVDEPIKQEAVIESTEPIVNEIPVETNSEDAISTDLEVAVDNMENKKADDSTI